MRKQRKNRVKVSNDVIPMCNCKLSRQYMEMHETKEFRNKCAFCDHYVYWGTWNECNASFEQVKENRVKNSNVDGISEYGYDKEVKVKAYLLYKELKSMRKVSEKLNINPTTLFTWKKKEGWKK